MATSQPAVAANGNAESQQLLLDRYNNKIQYYWTASQNNKRSYKTTRYATIILGALVTLISSLSAGKFFSGWAATTVGILTPMLAALLAIVGGISQAFQWGAAWSDMVITATRLEKERDRVAVTPLSQIDVVREMELLDSIVLQETQGFFQRLFGSGGSTAPSQPPRTAPAD